MAKRYEENAPKTEAYVLLDDKKPHVHDGMVVNPGDTVQLTEAQANAWSDKFKKVGSPSAPPKKEEKVASEKTARLDPPRVQDAGGQKVDLKDNPNPLNQVAITPGKAVGV